MLAVFDRCSALLEPLEIVGLYTYGAQRGRFLRSNNLLAGYVIAQPFIALPTKQRLGV